MARNQSLFHTQTKGLLLRTWHWERRQYCNIFCVLVLPPLLLILLFSLQRVIKAREVISQDFQLNPGGAFAPRPFDPSKCLQIERNKPDPIMECLDDPFLPKYEVPVYVPPQFSPIIGSRDAKDAQRNVGLLSGLSLQPFVYPPALPSDSSDFSEDQDSYDGVFLHSYFDGNRSHPGYEIFTTAASSNMIDEKYLTKTTSTASESQLRSTLYDQWRKGTIPGRFSTALSFESVSETPQKLDVSATVFYNDSITTNCTEACPLVSNIVRLENAIFQRLSPGNTAMAYLRRMPPIDAVQRLRIIELAISITIGLTTHFLLPSFLRFLVYERARRLRSMMAVMGLGRAQYWFGTYSGLLIQYCSERVLGILIGIAVSIPFYTDNNAVSYIVLFFLWGNVLVATAFLLASFFKSPETAQTVGWMYVILVNLVGGPYVGRRLGDLDTSEATWAAIMLLPSFAFFRSVYYAGAINSGGKGITLRNETYRDVNLGMCSGTGPFCQSYYFLAGEWVVIMLLAAYFEQVLPGVQGTRKHPLFFLGFKRKIKFIEDDEDGLEEHPQDVAQEEERANALVANMESSPFDGVVLKSLTKTYHGKPPVKALQNLSMVANRNEVLCILAHNGAGKTTVFRTLVGELEATAGNAYIWGNSILTDMKQVYRRLGVAPQQNILWESLTVQEHLYFYGRVKNLYGKDLKEAVNKALVSVQLESARKRKVRALSGGMKRRLSVSIAMIGDPQFIILDEPSTGLDILARKKLWETIRRVKHDKTILLTTHSLEEAETLSDRVAIMSQGRLKCIGEAEELKLRLGKGHHLSASLPATKVAEFHDAITDMAPGATMETRIGGIVDYVLPRSLNIAGVFRLMEQRREELEIRDWSINQSTLEDVFLRVTQSDMKRKSLKEEEIP